jgi:hypothetical protein
VYTYNIPVIPQSEFEKMRGYVEEAYWQVTRDKDAKPMTIVMATDTITDVPEKKRHKALPDSLMGYAWGGGIMWVRPCGPGRFYYDVVRTAIHELAHFRVPDQSHGPKWRKVFCVAWSKWLLSNGYNETEVRREVDRCLDQYRQYRQFTPQGKFNPYPNYRDKLRKEKESILKVINPSIPTPDPNRVRWLG